MAEVEQSRKPNVLDPPPSRSCVCAPPYEATTGCRAANQVTGLEGLRTWALRPDMVDAVQQPSSLRSSIPPQWCLLGLGKQHTGRAVPGLGWGALAKPERAWKRGSSCLGSPGSLSLYLVLPAK